MNSFQPEEQPNRLLVVDALRGLALLGILIANIPFRGEGMPGFSAFDRMLDTAFHLFIDKKFITIFSILFGFGFYIQGKRAGEKQVAFNAYYFRRMLLLLLIGCIHAYFFWFGDIIRDYAICGLFLLLVYKWPARRILITAIVFTVFLTGSVFIANSVLGLQEYSYDRSIALEYPLTTSYWCYLRINARIDPIVNFVQDSPITLVFCFGNMLIGFWMGKTGFFEKFQHFSAIRNRLIAAGATAGLLCSYLFWSITTGKLELTPALIWLPFVIVAGMLLQSLFYISVFIKLFHHTAWKKFLLVFAPVGKMALTNYIIQTFFYLAFFFHWTHGLKMYGKLSLAETYLACIILFLIQMVFSRWWLQKHEQGPLEKIWKKFSYRLSEKKPHSPLQPDSILPLT